MQGFVPARRGPFDKTQGRYFDSAKGPKTISTRSRLPTSAGTGSTGLLRLCPESYGSETRSAQTSPRRREGFGTPAPPRPTR